MRSLRLLSAPLLIAVAAASRAADFTLDYNTTTNPGATGWTYGLETALGDSSTFLTYDAHIVDANGYNLWYASSNHSSDVTPEVGLNVSGHSINGDLPGQAQLHPGPNGQLSVARYTIPTSGAAVVAGTFFAGDQGTLNEYVLVNGVTQFSAMSTGGDEPFAFTFNASANDTVDFVVQADAHGYSFDTTPLSATITQAVPEPAPLAALGMGALALLRRRKRA